MVVEETPYLFMIFEGGINGVEFIAVNTDAQALLNNKASIKIQIGENLTKGLGSGGDPEVGRQAAEESKERLKEELSGADMIFLACGRRWWNRNWGVSSNRRNC